MVAAAARAKAAVCGSSLATSMLATFGWSVKTKGQASAVEYSTHTWPVKIQGLMPLAASGSSSQQIMCQPHAKLHVRTGSTSSPGPHVYWGAPAYQSSATLSRTFGHHPGPCELQSGPEMMRYQSHMNHLCHSRGEAEIVG